VFQQLQPFTLLASDDFNQDYSEPNVCTPEHYSRLEIGRCRAGSRQQKPEPTSSDHKRKPAGSVSAHKRADQQCK
jgi:hypothetical protein